jgi:hypothetical protein
VAAQARAQDPNLQRPDVVQLRHQIQMFQGQLQTAVRLGGEAFVRDKAPFLPNQVQLTANDPEARGFAPPRGGGFLFYVAVPEIRITISELLTEQFLPPMPEMPPSLRNTSRQGDVRDASGAAGAQGIAPPDPMTASPADADTPVLDDGRCAMRAKPSNGDPTPNYWYSMAVCDALMDAMLDNSTALPIKESEWLTIMAVGEPELPRVNPGRVLTTSYTTYLEIKGADLLAYRQGRLTKEQARKLIEMQQR